MGEVQIFNNPQFGNIRTSGTPDNPLFCLSDVCKALHLSASHVKERLSEDVVSTDTLKTAGGMQKMNFINEDGLYDVILDSRKPEAKVFRKWVTSEVLPSIRKTGNYSVTTAIPDFTNPAEAARAWAEQYELKELEAKRADEAESQVLELSHEIEQTKPKVGYFEAFMQSTHGSKSSCIREVVKQAHIKSEQNFIAWMIEKHILFRSQQNSKLQAYREYTSCFDLIDVYDPRNDWSGKQLKMNPFGKSRIVKRYHDEHPEAFYDQKQLFNM